MNEWIAYYDSDHSIYVSARHRDAHFRTLANDLRRLIPSPDARVLDYSCGEALMADRVAEGCAELVLCEPAPGVRQRLRQRFGGNAKIRIAAPDELAQRLDGMFDFIAMVSVTQYMSAAELNAALAKFRRLLAPSGTLFIGDVISDQASTLHDVWSLVRFAAREGFLRDALIGLVRMALSDYSRLRARTGLSRYSEAAFAAHLARAGFAVRRAPRNIGHNSARMSFLATIAPATR